MDPPPVPPMPVISDITPENYTLLLETIKSLPSNYKIKEPYTYPYLLKLISDVIGSTVAGEIDPTVFEETIKATTFHGSKPARLTILMKKLIIHAVDPSLLFNENADGFTMLGELNQEYLTLEDGDLVKMVQKLMTGDLPPKELEIIHHALAFYYPRLSFADGLKLKMFGELTAKELITILSTESMSLPELVARFDYKSLMRKFQRWANKGLITVNTNDVMVADSDISCQYCKKKGHQRKDCWKLKKTKGGKDAGKDKKETSTEKNETHEDLQYVDFNNDIFPNYSESRHSLLFILDTGATTHVTNQTKLLINKRPTNTIIRGATGTFRCTEEGDMIISNNLRIEGVKLLEKAPYNIISMGKITKRGCQVVLNESGGEIVRNGSVAMSLTKKNKFWVIDKIHTEVVLQLEDTTAPPMKPMETTNKSEDLMKLHLQTGHSSAKQLYQVAQDHISLTKCSQQDCLDTVRNCSGCKMLVNRPKKKSGPQATLYEVGALLQADFVGPIMGQYLLVASDRSSKVIKYRILSTRKDASKPLIELLNWFQLRARQYHNKNILRLRVDNEFATNQIKTWCSANGVDLETTAPGSSHQNGSAERANRFLQEKALKLLDSAAVPRSYWHRAMAQIIFLHNRLPHPALGCSPLNKLEGSFTKNTFTPSGIFGCKSFVKAEKSAGKFKTPSIETVFLGYDQSLAIGVFLTPAGKLIRSSKFNLVTNVFPFKDPRGFPQQSAVGGGGASTGGIKVGGDTDTCSPDNDSAASNKDEAGSDTTMTGSDTSKDTATATKTDATESADTESDTSMETTAAATNTPADVTESPGTESDTSREAPAAATATATTAATHDNAMSSPGSEGATSQQRSLAHREFFDVAPDSPASTSPIIEFPEDPIDTTGFPPAAAMNPPLIEPSYSSSSSSSASSSALVARPQIAPAVPPVTMVNAGPMVKLFNAYNSPAERYIQDPIHMLGVTQTKRRHDDSGTPSSSSKMRHLSLEDIQMLDKVAPEEMLILLTQAINEDVEIEIPRSMAEALRGSESVQWENARLLELEFLRAHEVYEEVQFDPKIMKELVDTKYVLSVKHELDGSVVYKIRLVARGFKETTGKDTTSYSPVSGLESVRLMLSLAAQHRWSLASMDAQRAFLQAPIGHDVYVKPPKGCSTPQNKVWKLKKSLYGLRSSPMNWFHHLQSILNEFGMVQSQIEQCLFTFGSGEVMISTYVDDILITGSNDMKIAELKRFLHSKLSIKERPVTKFLGINISYNQEHGDLTLSLQSYLEDIAKEFAGKLPLRRYDSPMVQGYTGNDESVRLIDHEIREFQSIIGVLNYTVNTVRCDIAYPVNILCQFVKSPTKSHLAAAKRVLVYVLGTANVGIQYGHGTKRLQELGQLKPIIRVEEQLRLSVPSQSSPQGLLMVSDASYANCETTRKSHSGYIIFHNGDMIDWRTGKQKLVSLSSCESEYIAYTTTARNGLFFHHLLTEILPSYKGPLALAGDNLPALLLAKNKASSKMSKHIQIRYHFIRELVNNGLVQLFYINTNNNVADGLTKSLDRTKFRESRAILMEVPSSDYKS